MSIIGELRLSGILDETEKLEGQVFTDQNLQGNIASTAMLSGTVTDNGDNLSGSIDDKGKITGRVSPDQSLSGAVTRKTSLAGQAIPVGPQGKPGYTPIKGVDYFTEDDIKEVAAEAAKLVGIETVTPEQVVFPNGAITTHALGKVTLVNGMGTLVKPGGTLKDFFDNFVDEKNPATTEPSVSVSVSVSGPTEVGYVYWPFYKVRFDRGNYTYGPDTEIIPTSFDISDTLGNSASTEYGVFGPLLIEDDTKYTVTATVTYDAGSTPVTNIGNEYPAGRIPAGSKTVTSDAITGYRRMFWGTTNDKEPLDSDAIRRLISARKNPTNGETFNVVVPRGAMRVVIAYPATLQDLTSVKDTKVMNLDIVSAFTKSIIGVEGADGYKAIDYKVYTQEFSKPYDTNNVYSVTI